MDLLLESDESDEGHVESLLLLLDIAQVAGHRTTNSSRQSSREVMLSVAGTDSFPKPWWTCMD
jgi:hypothetical protein